MNATKERSWSPVEGETFEAITVGNVMVKIYRRRRTTANRKKKRFIFEVGDYTSGRRDCAVSPNMVRRAMKPRKSPINFRRAMQRRQK